MRDAAHKLTAPILMLQAGNDSYVDKIGQDFVCNQAKDCLRIVFPTSRHEMWNEVDRLRDAVMSEISRFLVGDECLVNVSH